MPFQFTPSQQILARETARNIVVNAGRRFGKSTWVAYEMLGCAISGKDKIVWYFAPTYDAARGIMWRTLQDIAKPSTVSVNETRLELTVKTIEGGTSTISLFGWDRSDNRRGLGLDLVAFDEVAFMKDFSHYWLTVFQPALLDKKGRAIFTSTPNGFNDFYDLTETAKTTPNWAYYHFTSYDNPRNDPAELERYKGEYTAKGKENSFYQEYMGEFRKSEGLVYKNFTETFHVKDIEYNPSRYKIVIMGVDWGYRDPTCAVFIGQRHDGVFEAFAEYQAFEQTVEESIKQLVILNGQYPVRETYPDSADQGAFKALALSGFNPIDIDKSAGSPARGIDTVRSLLQKNSLYVSPKCPKLIEAFQKYHYKDKGTSEDPDHEYSDMLDALR